MHGRTIYAMRQILRSMVDDLSISDNSIVSTDVRNAKQHLMDAVDCLKREEQAESKRTRDRITRQRDEQREKLNQEIRMKKPEQKLV